MAFPHLSTFSREFRCLEAPAPSTAAMPGAEPGIRWDNQLHLEFPMASCPVHTMISLGDSLGDDANGEL